MTAMEPREVDILLLPADLGSLSDEQLHDFNDRLRAKKAQLDWTAVEIAPAAALDLFLQGLAVDRDADVLGSDTVSDNLASAVLEALERGAPAPPKPLPKRVKRPTPQVVATTDEEDDPRPPWKEVGSDEPEVVEPPVLSPPTPTELRNLFVRMVADDLLGPVSGPDEEVTTSVTERYILGKLAPQATMLSTKPDLPEEDDAEDPAYAITPDLLPPDPAGDEGGEEAPVEPVATGPRPTYPSSLGLSFTVSGDVDEIEIAAEWGKYERVASEIHFNAEEEPRRVWRREPRGGVVRLPLRQGEINPLPPDPSEPDVVITGRIRTRRGHDGDWAVTLFLNNNQVAPKTSKGNQLLDRTVLVETFIDAGLAFFPSDDLSLSTA